MSGFIALHREAVDHHLFSGDAQRMGAWFWLLAKACWKPTKFSVSGATITLERGQLCVSRSQLAAAWGMSPSGVERFLTRLETEQMIERETGQGRTVITICNYGKYQDVSGEAGQDTGQATGQRSDSDRTTKEQGNKGTREEEPNGSPSQRAGAPEGDHAGASDLFGDDASNRKEPKTRRKRAPNVRPAFELPDWVPAEEWRAFLAMREKIKHPPTEEALHLLVKKLDQLRSSGNDPGEVLEQSTMNDWRGIFEVRKSRNDQRNGYGDWSAPSRDRGPRPRTDGFTDAINDALARTGSGPPSEEAGRWNDGYAAGDQGLRPARARVIR